MKQVRTIEKTLTDGSKVFDVELCDKYSDPIVFLCENEQSAEHFAEQLRELIDTHTCEDAFIFPRAYRRA